VIYSFHDRVWGRFELFEKKSNSHIIKKIISKKSL
jgi:uncharacterized membrane protein